MSTKQSQLCVTPFDRPLKAVSIGLSKRETHVDPITTDITVDQGVRCSL